MKPKTKLHHRVMELFAKLPKLTDEQTHWGIHHCLSHVGFRTKNKTNCMDCGHSWPSGDNSLLLTKLQDKVKCPGCGNVLSVKDTKQRVFAQRKFYAVLDKQAEFQIIRIFEIRSFHKTGQPVKADMLEVVIQWLLVSGKWEYVARQRGGMGLYNDAFTGSLQIKNKAYFDDKYNIYPTNIYPKMKLLPMFKRNGFKGKWHALTPHDLLSNLCNPKCETLLKSNQFGLLQDLVTSRRSTVEKYWNSIKICIRNNYVLTDKNVITWLDYMNLLDYFQKDLRNPTYVCPENLKREHDKYVIKKAEVEKRKTLEARRLKAEQEQADYQRSKGIFFGMAFTDDELSIQVIETVYDFIKEGEALQHCVWTNEYYKKDNSLILSARIEGKPVETIEINLERMQVVQSRGLKNRSTPYSDRVRELLRKNMQVVRKKYKELKTVAA